MDRDEGGGAQGVGTREQQHDTKTDNKPTGGSVARDCVVTPVNMVTSFRPCSSSVLVPIRSYDMSLHSGLLSRRAYSSAFGCFWKCSYSIYPRHEVKTFLFFISSLKSGLSLPRLSPQGLFELTSGFNGCFSQSEPLNGKGTPGWHLWVVLLSPGCS